MHTERAGSAGSNFFGSIAKSGRMLRMKSCPTCNRTYADDSFTFCLDDGALLSASYDPYSTLQIPAARNTDQPATEILRSPSTLGGSHKTQPPPTIRVSEPFNYAQAPVAEPLRHTSRRTSGKILGGVIALLSAGVLLPVSYTHLTLPTTPYV